MMTVVEYRTVMSLYQTKAVSLMWSSSCNENSLITDFVAEVNKDNAPVGGGASADYDKFCGLFKVISCPHVKFDGPSCKLLNCVIDLPNFRAMLLACATTNSEIKEIIIHNTTLSAQHIQDLRVVLEKIGPLQAVKIDYIRDVSGVPLPPEYFRPLLSAASLVSYLSFKGNQLDDTFILENSKFLSENMTLKALNLSENIITDTGAAELFDILPRTVSLSYLSLKRNKIDGVSLSNMAVILTGKEISPDDDATLKSIAKSVVDRNKLLKDINKKRKGKFTELTDLVAPTDRVVKIGSASLLVHRTAASIDLSYNPITAANFQSMMSIFSEKSQAVKDAGIAECHTALYMLGMDDGAMAVAQEYLDSGQYHVKLTTKLASQDEARCEGVSDV